MPAQEVFVASYEHPYDTDIEVDGVDCLRGIKVAIARAEQSVGLGPANLPFGWTCNSNSGCSKRDARVTFSLAYEP